MEDVSIFVPVVVAIITGLFSIIGQYFIAKENKRKTDAERQVRDAQTEMRLDRIEKKIDEHNGYAQKFSEFAVALAELRTEIKLSRNSQ